MKEPFKFSIIFLGLFVLAGCATVPLQQKSFIDQAIWNETTKDKVFDACLTALTISNIAVHPLGINKESGLIVTKPRLRYLDGSGNKTTIWHYTLQILVSGTQGNKVMVTATAVDAGYNGRPPEPWMTDMRQYFNDSIAHDLESFFTQLDILLGKAEYHRSGKVLFPIEE
ncbi:MAG: hypothetical protein R6X10_09340 [Desulfobacterales bacterium]